MPVQPHGDKISIDESALKNLLQRMIRIESINPLLAGKGSAEKNLSRFIGSQLKKCGMKVRYQKLGRNRCNVIGRLPGTGGGRSLMLNGHMDTVGTEGMEIDPFGAEFKDGRIYGRGSLDMKAGLAAQIAAVRSLVRSGSRLKGDLIMACVADEEYGSLGAESLVREYRADAAIVCEPTLLYITVAHKGYSWIRVRVHGRAAHGSLPEQGIDAIMMASRFLVELDKYARYKLSAKSHHLLGSPSLHASLISGGTELSTYPALCTIELERRNLPGEGKQTVIKEFQDLIHRLTAEDPQFRADFEILASRPGLEIPKDSPIVVCLDRARQEVLNLPSEFIGVSGWIDSAILAEHGIPTVVFGPSGNGLHSAVEYVEFDSVVQTAQVLVSAIRDFCGAD